MKNLLIFFHGKGTDCKSKKDLIAKIAKKYNAEPFSFNAPIKYKNGFSWFEKDENKEVIIETLNFSLDYIVDIVNKKLNKEGLTWNNVVLCGHSQGGLLATYLGIKFNVSKVISICGDMPYNLDYTSEKFSRKVPICWVEGGNDTYLSEVRKTSYNLLKKENYNIKVVVNEKSFHDDLDESILEDIN